MVLAEQVQWVLGFPRSAGDRDFELTDRVAIPSL